MNNSLPPNIPHLIGGDFHHSLESEKMLKRTSPWDGNDMPSVPYASIAMIENAGISAARALQDWRRTPIKERSEYLYRYKSEVLKIKSELAQIISYESGKLVGEAQAEIDKGIEVLDYALSLQNKITGGKIEVSRGVTCEYLVEPVGVGLLITPFNFPFMVPMWSIPIALVLGNTLIWKPSEKVASASYLVAECFKKAKFPPGVFNIVQGDAEVTKKLITLKEVTAVSFVGSSPVAKSVYFEATQRMKRVLSLGGAKNPIIVMPDARMEDAAKNIVASFTGCAGQRCMAASLLYLVQGSERILPLLTEITQSLRIGIDVGAMITSAQVEKLQRVYNQNSPIQVKNASTAPSEFKNGNWFAPVIFNPVAKDSILYKEELFGPILSIHPVPNLKAALTLENENPFGNAISVFTESGKVAHEVAKESSAGMCGINIGVPVPREPFSFGGTKESKFGYGDITGDSSVSFWTNQKKITTKWYQSFDNNWMS